MKHFNELINSGEILFFLKNLDLFNKKVSLDTIQNRLDLIAHDEKSVLSAYEYAFREKNTEYALALYNHPKTKCHYDFLGDLRAPLLQKLGILKLPPVLFCKEGMSFDDVLKMIFSSEDISPFKRRTRQAILKFGTVFINNLIILKEMIEIKENFDEILSLDHQKEISSVFLKYDPSRSGQFSIRALKNLFSVNKASGFSQPIL